MSVAGEGKPEVGVERAFVELVEGDRGDALEHRIVEDEPGEDAFGDDLDARLSRDFRAEAHPQSHRLADAFAKRLGHAFCRGTGREPARFEHKDAAAFGPRFPGEHQRHPGRLAGTGRRHQHGRVLRA